VPEHPEARKVKQHARKELRKVKLQRERGDRKRQKQPLCEFAVTRRVVAAVGSLTVAGCCCCCWCCTHTVKKCLFFQRKVVAAPEKTVWSDDEMSELIRQYIGRFDKELQEISNSKGVRYGNSGKHKSREEELKAEIRKEINDFSFGAYEVPDLTDATVVDELRQWNGSLQRVSRIKQRCFKDTLGGEIKPMPGYWEYDDDGHTIYGDGDDNANLDDLDDDLDDDDDDAAEAEDAAE
jgi:hypothetical protein